MKLALVLAFALAGAFAQADQFKTVDFKQTSDHYVVDVSYPEFFSTSIPAYQQINHYIYKTVVTEGGCGEWYEGDPDYDYSATARVVGLNKRYVGVEVWVSDYCGGAHPNYYSYWMTFDSNNGKPLEIFRELGFKAYDDRDYNYQQAEIKRRELANLIVDMIPEDGLQCMEGMTRDEKIEELVATYWPRVAGLAKGKTIVISTDVPHAMKPCEFSLRLTYQQAQSMIVPGSYLHTWLQ